MTIKLYPWLFCAGLALTAACSKDPAPAGTGTEHASAPPATNAPTEAPPAKEPAPTPASDPKPKEPELVWDGGRFEGETIAVRAVPWIGSGGAAKPSDVWAEDAMARRWVRLAKNVGYGKVSDWLAVPKGFGTAFVYFFPVDEGPPLDDPRASRSRGVPVDWNDGPNGKGPFTVIVTDERDYLTSQSINEAEPARDFAPSDKPRIQFRIALVQGVGLPNLEFGTAEGACLDSNAGYNEGLIEVSAGTLTPVLYDAGQTSGCKGPRLAQAEAVTLAGGEIALVVATGKSQKELGLVALKLGGR